MNQMRKLMVFTIIGLFIGAGFTVTIAENQSKNEQSGTIQMSSDDFCNILYPNGGEEITGGCEVRWEVDYPVVSYGSCLSQIRIGEEESDLIVTPPHHRYCHTLNTKNIDDGMYKAHLTVYLDEDDDGIPDCILGKDASDGLFTVTNGPYQPCKPSGPVNGRPGIEYTFSTSTTHSHGDDWDIEYMFSWGDGDRTEWLGPFPSGQQVFANHSWNENGSYSVRVQAKGPWDRESKWSESLEVRISQSAPEKPTLTGPSEGKTGVEYTFNVSTNDLDGDDVFYLFDWYTEVDSEWQGPVSSGATYSATHVFSNNGSYSIKVKAKDSYGAESDWSDPLVITMPKDKQVDSLFFRFTTNQKPVFSILQELFSFNLEE